MDRQPGSNDPFITFRIGPHQDSKFVHLIQEGSTLTDILIYVLSFAGGLFTSTSAALSLFVAKLTKPSLIYDLTKDLFLDQIKPGEACPEQIREQVETVDNLLFKKCATRRLNRRQSLSKSM